MREMKEVRPKRTYRHRKSVPLLSRKVFCPGLGPWWKGVSVVIKHLNRYVKRGLGL